MQPWKAVAGMAWLRPDPAGSQGGPLWSAAPGAPGTRWAALKPAPGQHPAFVDKLRDDGGLQVQRSLDIDWVKVAHSVTKDIFPEEGQRAALHSVHRPTPPIGYGQARDYVLLRYGHIPEGRGAEAFGSTLADNIFTEVSVRAETCRPDVHYKVVDNRLWHTLGSYVEPPPESTRASRRTTSTGGTKWETSTRRSSACIGWRTTSLASRGFSSPSWTWTRPSTPIGRRRPGGPPLGSSEEPMLAGAPSTCSSTEGEPTVDPHRRWEPWQSPDCLGSRIQARLSGSPNGRTGSRAPCPRESSCPRPPRLARRRAPRGPGRPPTTSRLRLAVTGGLCPRTHGAPPQGGPARVPGARLGPRKEQQGPMPRASCRFSTTRRARTFSHLLHARRLGAPAQPRQELRFHHVTPLGEEVIKRLVPRTRWPHGNGYVEQL